MLTEKRQEEILKLLDTRGSLTVQELTEYFQASESTIRRDLTVLDKKGALVKVFGGAVQKEKKLITREEKVSLRMELYRVRPYGKKSFELADMLPLLLHLMILSTLMQALPQAASSPT